MIHQHLETTPTNGSRRQPADHHPPGDPYEPLVQRLRAIQDGVPPAIGITSCRQGEGVSTVAANLAISAARSGSVRVLLVDANIDHPSIAATFAVDPCPGLAEALSQVVHPAGCIQQTSSEKLSVMAAGAANGPAKSGSLPADLADLLKNLRQAFEEHC